MNNLMFGKIASGMCRLSMSGEIAVKTNNGYKSFDIKKNQLTNCDHFVFDIGEEFFFLVPTNRVEIGDIILVNGKPKCVTKKNDDKTITVINDEDSTIETLLPERHMFMGNVCFYGKIVSMFGNNFSNSPDCVNRMINYMMLSEMVKNQPSNNNSFNSILPLMMMNNGANMFTNMFDMDDLNSVETNRNDGDNF